MATNESNCVFNCYLKINCIHMLNIIHHLDNETNCSINKYSNCTSNIKPNMNIQS